MPICRFFPENVGQNDRKPDSLLKKTLRLAVGTPICQIVPVARAYGGGWSFDTLNIKAGEMLGDPTSWDPSTIYKAQNPEKSQKKSPERSLGPLAPDPEKERESKRQANCWVSDFLLTFRTFLVLFQGSRVGGSQTFRGFGVLGCVDGRGDLNPDQPLNKKVATIHVLVIHISYLWCSHVLVSDSVVLYHWRVRAKKRKALKPSPSSTLFLRRLAGAS